MKLKTILIACICISIASACGVSANQLIPPIFVDLDIKYLDGDVLNGINKIGQYGSAKVHQMKDFVVINLADVFHSSQS
ncbi:hypothetical protein AB4455_02865 [Vibrio sp. 10N.261.46.E12]|uniref:hypothetical protein n=1 Tax=unclassified Vibrio TaxID=2614977 RepID=UPI00097687E1|nr:MULTISPECIES: hypothetical protein [unclassified Vibrio]OMO33334.1 hypothetical protein BH584_15160 [Vibrio sp. 10N.261.45.E1]PMJ27810.1 hypothetical protein BCU27_06365 [Vibrio sp. 10N.286.45.B6]PML88131.1 hypothetical protein BCT66_11075 [Vibrio sp. 10N.261.49.E11]PMM67459.1 hypothetical protein BCT48_15550 [Vibrio sp. 10N.261.46.F12]PMM81658.1 hypothetical protein BCT46_14710 [Vibrio sp. 10N.261.46.E8]